MSESFELRNTDSFIAVVVGTAGQRIFFLQGVDGDQVVTLKLEKTQVGALASALRQLLDKHNVEEAPAQLLPPAEPLTAAWTVAELGAGIDPSTDVIVVMARELTDAEGTTADDDGGTDDGDDAANEPATALFHLRSELVVAFCEQARLLVEDGRDFARRNGHRPLKD